uniref:Ribonuclease K6 n=1 Tax=Cavia porcellus TaxID=10141 RepID=W0UVH0_CAVPO|nr:TPA: ribonuclease A D2 [Cavia porcellus]
MVRAVRFPLLLLLCLFGLLCPFWAVSQDLTPFQMFQHKHVQPDPRPCDPAMTAVNELEKNHKCRPTNTFLHNSLQNVIDVCTLPNQLCRNGQNNCHQSIHPVKMTVCQLTKGQYPNCYYRTDSTLKNFTVACEPPQQEDPRQYPLVPVHFDAIVHNSQRFSSVLTGSCYYSLFCIFGLLFFLLHLLF